MMVYEARHSKSLNFTLAGTVLALSILGFVANGVIPSESTRVGGTYPLVGWAIVAACFLAALVFVRRALDRSPQVRIDEKGIYAKRRGPDPAPWDDIVGFHVIVAGIQRIARFKRGGGHQFGINTTFYDHGMNDLIAAVRHYRPDLIA